MIQEVFIQNRGAKTQILTWTLRKKFTNKKTKKKDDKDEDDDGKGKEDKQEQEDEGEEH